MTRRILFQRPVIEDIQSFYKRVWNWKLFKRQNICWRVLASLYLEVTRIWSLPDKCWLWFRDLEALCRGLYICRQAITCIKKKGKKQHLKKKNNRINTIAVIKNHNRLPLAFDKKRPVNRTRKAGKWPRYNVHACSSVILLLFVYIVIQLL